MSLFDSLKSIMDQSGDGRISHEDIESLRSGENGGIINKLESVADQNQDGKLGMDDLSSLDVGTIIDDLKNKYL